MLFNLKKTHSLSCHPKFNLISHFLPRQVPSMNPSFPSTRAAAPHSSPPGLPLRRAAGLSARSGRREAGEEGVAGIAARVLVCSASWELLLPHVGPTHQPVPRKRLEEQPICLHSAGSPQRGGCWGDENTTTEKTHTASGARESPPTSMTGTI